MQTDNKSDGTVTFECTLGEVGCKACLIHSCAIHHVKDEAQLVKYISCMMTNEGNQQPSEIGKTVLERFTQHLFYTTKSTVYNFTVCRRVWD